MYGSVRGAAGNGGPYRDGNCTILLLSHFRNRPVLLLGSDTDRVHPRRRNKTHYPKKRLSLRSSAMRAFRQAPGAACLV